MANELTDEGLEVMAIERGPWRDAPTDFPPDYMQDELRYRVRHELFLRPDQLTFSFRNKVDQTALPIRSWGAFMPPNGVGGGGVHWNAEMWRFLPSDFVLKTHLTERYGASFLPEDMTIQDWGITYDELEPFYDRFEYLVRHVRNGRQSQGADPAGWQSVRRAAFPALSDAGTSAAFQPHAVRQGRAGSRLQAVSSAFRQSLAGLYKSAGPQDGSMHLLRLLRMVRMQQLLESQSANHDPSLSRSQTELLRARQLGSDQNQRR